MTSSARSRRDWGIERRGLFYGDVARLGTLEDFVDHTGNGPEQNRRESLLCLGGERREGNREALAIEIGTSIPSARA